MSVIIREPDGRIKVLTKGADSVLSELLAPIDMNTQQGKEQAQIREQTAHSLSQHATEGLRTLLICEKRITEAEYDDWVEKYQNALNNQGPERARKIEKVAKIIEQDLNVLGSTAVQDNL